MTWTLTPSLEQFLGSAGDFLRAEPVLNTVLLTVCERLRDTGPAAFGDDPPRFGWHETVAGRPDAAFLQTPPYPLLTAPLPEGAATSLIAALTAARLRPASVNLQAPEAAEFAAAWRESGGGTATALLRSRLFVLGSMQPPDPPPAGAARLAGRDDYDLLIAWHEAFHDEAGLAADDPHRTVEARLSEGGLQLWEDGGLPVAMAAALPAVAGVARVAGVYTPPQSRRRGYGGGVTTAVTRAAVSAGAADVVLFTDQANPTSNALYQRLGYRPVTERIVLDLQAGDVTHPAAASSSSA
jgi:ribosomal protein S18 acetylase RimI-like enzyme